MTLVKITNEPRAYAWGKVGGIAAALGNQPTDVPEAELWLGAHAGSPSRTVTGAPWKDLAEWQTSTGSTLPFLLKVLAAGAPLSLQAHPTEARARESHDREQRAGIPVDAAHRNYRDPYAKPELIVALEDGFRALCGFRPRSESQSFARRVNERHATVAGRKWADVLDEEDGIRQSVEWLLSGDDDTADLTAELVRQARENSADTDLDLTRLLAEHYELDPGVVVAQLLNDVTLSKHECLWLAAGNIHAYLSGTGIELMGPSDNVLRGGLTPKHVDVAELLEVLDFTPGPPPYLRPVQLSDHAASYRPSSLDSGADCPFQLLLITSDIEVQLDPAVAISLEGEFTLTAGGDRIDLHRGQAAFLDTASAVRCAGEGALFVATTSVARTPS